MDASGPDETFATVTCGGEQIDYYEPAKPGDQIAETANSGLAIWDAGDDTDPIEPRGWLLGNVFCRRFVSSLIADGGVGKSALRYAQLIALATGRPLTGDHVFVRARVLIVCLEDDRDELRRRIRAAMLHHKIEATDIQGWLYLAATGAAAGRLMITDEHGRPTPSILAANLEQVIQAHRIDVVCLDPFVKAHAVEENQNTAIDGVMQILTDLAAKHDIAVDVPHHTSKGLADAGNANRGRGASAMKDAARLVYTLAPMMPDDARTFGLSEAERRRLVRMDAGKVNIAPPLDEAKWFRLVGVNLGNATETYPNGDEVQTVEPWTPPDAWAGLSHHLLNAVLNDIDAGLEDGDRYSDAASATTRAAWKIVIKHAPDKSEADARRIIKTWVENGVLVPADYESPTTRKTVRGLRVSDAKRPS